MAEALLREIADREGLDIDVGSAGTSAWDGAPANPLAAETAAAAGLDLSDHEARLVTAELVRWADIVLGMSMSHVFRIRQLDPTCDARVITEFAPGGGNDAGVSDPIGLGIEAYEAAFQEIRGCLESFVASRKPSSD